MNNSTRWWFFLLLLAWSVCIIVLVERSLRCTCYYNVPVCFLPQAHEVEECTPSIPSEAAVIFRIVSPSVNRTTVLVVATNPCVCPVFFIIHMARVVLLEGGCSDHLLLLIVQYYCYSRRGTGRDIPFPFFPPNLGYVENCSFFFCCFQKELLVSCNHNSSPNVRVIFFLRFLRNRLHAVTFNVDT